MDRQPAPQFAFEGFARPNYTQVPDELFDVLLPTLADNELRVLLYIIRRTFGFKRDSDTISLSQMVKGIVTRDGTVLDSGTGLSKSTVARATKSLREKGIIVATRNASKEKGDQPTTYRLRFKTESTPDNSTTTNPLSRQQDTPRVSSVGQAVSRGWDTQQTARQETDFESSKGEDLEWDREGESSGETERVYQTTSGPDRTASSFSDNSLGQILQHRIRRDAGKSERQQIGAAIAQIAPELGDRAEVKVSTSRAMNLYQASDASIASFVDLLYQAKGEVLDRYRYPGKAPLPRNRMAYFFAVVEDWLGLRDANAPGSHNGHSQTEADHREAVRQERVD